ncbi:hypothetical protein NPIL_599471, partial [Nephila pilipes]
YRREGHGSHSPGGSGGGSGGLGLNGDLSLGGLSL